MLRDGQGVEVKAERSLPSLQEELLWVRRKHRGLALLCQGSCWGEIKGWQVFPHKPETVYGGSRTPVASIPPSPSASGTSCSGVGVRVRVLRATTAPQGPGTWLAESAVRLLLLLKFQEWHRTALGSAQVAHPVAGVPDPVSLCRCFAGRTGAELSPGLQGPHAAGTELLQAGCGHSQAPSTPWP